MSLSTTSIKRPVLAIVMNLIIILFGVLGYSFLGVREYPSIDPPIVSVRTTYTGADARVIESQITEPLEKEINSIEGIKNISSASNQGSSSITIEFSLDRDLEEAANDVRDKVSRAVRNLPDDIDGLPVVSKADANASSIIAMTLHSDVRTHLEISDYADNYLAQRLQTIPGVSRVQVWGEKRYAMRLWLDPGKLASYGLTPLDVRNALNRENVELPSGKLVGSNTELLIRTAGNLTTEDEFNNMVLLNDGNNLIRLRDVGRASLEPENLETVLRESGKVMIGLAIVPQPGANYLSIAEEFYKRFEQLKNEIPPDYTVNIAFDDTLFIKQSVTEVAETILIALTLVILIIFIFFRDWSIAFRPLIDIPVSLIGTFFIMYLLGFSVNILTLLAIVLATGLVVDDGIVVTENIFKKLEEGESPIQAAIKGSNEIFFAVISISVTLAAVFLPIIFLEGFVGRLFREFGVVIASAVLISAFVSLSLTPMLNAFLLKKRGHKQTRFYKKTEPLFEKMNSGYAASLNSFLNRRWLAIPILLGCLGLIGLFWVILPKETAPYEDRGALRLTMSLQEGASYEYTDAYMVNLINVVNDSIPEKNIILTVTAPGFSGSGAANTGFGFIRLKPSDERERSQEEIANKITELTKNYSAGRVFVTQQPTISVGRRGGLPIQYVLQAPNFEKLEEYLPQFMAEVNKDPTFTVTDVDLKFNKPELSITIDRAKASSLGVSVMDIAQTLQLAFSGGRFGYFTMNGRQYSVIGQFPDANRNEPLDLTSLFVRNNQGQIIQMDNLVKIEETSSPPQLYHFNRFMSATVSAGLAPGRTIGDGIEAMDAIAARVLDDTFSTALSGEARDYTESSSNTFFAFIMALILIYLILAAQFESFIDPFIIILTVPLAVAGAFLSLWLFGQSWNVFSQIGTIMLIGLVTKNGILIVEFANQLKEQGLSKAEAIRRGAVSRLRPILMTSFAIAIGALPIALALGAAATSRIGMGVVIIGGTLFSLVLTLYVIPAMYLYWSKEGSNLSFAEEAEADMEKKEKELVTLN